MATATPGLTVPGPDDETHWVDVRLLITVFAAVLLALAWHGPVAASNRAGATSDEIMVRPVTFGSMASFITSGMEAAGGLWVGQLVLAFLFAALFNFTAGYWLAASLTILLVLAVAPRGEAISPPIFPNSRPGPGENRPPRAALPQPGGSCPAPVTPYHYPPSENHRISSLRTPGLPPRGRFGPIWSP